MNYSNTFLIKAKYDFVGLSSEIKPTDVKNGSTFLEVDTSNYYIFYEGIWYKQSSSSGGDDEETLTPVTENLSFDNLVLPSNMNITLSKNILDYFSAEEKAEIESQLENDGYASYYFYQYADIPHVGEEEDPPENRISNLNLDLSIGEEGVYRISVEGNFHRTGDTASNEFYIKFSSLDGINFFVSSFSVLYWNDGAEYSVIPQKMEFPVTINFSEIVNESEDAKGWNDVLSEFLYTSEE